MEVIMRKFNHLLVAVAAISALVAVGCSEGEQDLRADADARQSIGEMPFNTVKVYIPKSEEDSKRLREAKENGLSLILFSKEELTVDYTDFSHAYQMIGQPNGEFQLEEIEEEVSPEETGEVDSKQILTLLKEDEGFHSERTEIGSKANCYLKDADATDPTLATRYMLCHGNLLVIEKEIPQTEEVDAENQEADAEVGAEEVEVVAGNNAE